MTKRVTNSINKGRLGEFFDVIPFRLQTKRQAEIEAELYVKFDADTRGYDVYLRSSPFKTEHGFFGDTVVCRTNGRKIFRRLFWTRESDADDILRKARGCFDAGSVVPEPRW